MSEQFTQTGSSSHIRFRPLDAVCGTLLYAYILLGPISRDLGIVGFISVVAVCAIYCAARRTPLDWALLALALLSSTYGVLSYYHVFPRSWTTLYDPEYIVRQLATIPAFLFIFSAMRHLWTTLLYSLSSRVFSFLMVVLPAASIPLVELFRAAGSGFSLPNLIGSSVIFFIGLGVILLSWRRTLRNIAFVVLLTALVIFFTRNAQTLLASMLLILVFISPKPRIVAIGMGTLALCLLMTSPFLFQLAPYISDPNTTLRLLIWSDAFTAFSDSLGLGIGFGTEAVRNFYAAHTAVTPFPEENILAISTHNSFVFLFMRTGIIGGLLFLVFCYRIAFSGSAQSPAHLRVAIYCWCLGILSLSVNVALESPLFMLGVAAAFSLTSSILQGGVGQARVASTRLRSFVPEVGHGVYLANSDRS
ncbi:O-antigen ligase family protein [Rhodoligotrophos ferricapiens]|uniref:O-antigen ligase family protein n=1 Tax=Rhodoligotrophos ferricapiens TaxID=3069264 RepID=UPI00315D89D8